MLGLFRIVRDWIQFMSSGVLYILCVVYVWLMFGVCLVYAGFMFGSNVFHVGFIVGSCLVNAWLDVGCWVLHVRFLFGLVLLHLWFAICRFPANMLVYCWFMFGLFLVYFGLDWIGFNFWFTDLALSSLG